MIQEIRGLLLLLSTLIMSAVFVMTKNSDYTNLHSYFPFNDSILLTRDTYVYFLFERLIMVVMALYIYFESVKFKTALKAFVFIQVFDAIDYLLTYNKTWVLDGFMISLDLVKVTLFSLVIASEVLKMMEQRLQKD